MRGPKPTPIELNEAEQTALEQLVKRHTVGQQLALRGRIILAAGAGHNNSQIARELGVSVDMVRLWRKRWLTLQAIPLADVSVAERLEDLPRPGSPARITADQRCQIERLACEQPEISGRPITHWTHQEIADELVKQGIVKKISARHAGRLLKRRGYQTASHSLLADARGG
jgi:transposase